MGTITTVGLDIAKSVFQVHGIDAVGEVIVRKQLSRARVFAVLHALPYMSIAPSEEPWFGDGSEQSIAGRQESLRRSIGERLALSPTTASKVTGQTVFSLIMP